MQLLLQLQQLYDQYVKQTAENNITYKIWPLMRELNARRALELVTTLQVDN